jgi:hypothetical protein
VSGESVSGYPWCVELFIKNTALAGGGGRGETERVFTEAGNKFPNNCGTMDRRAPGGALARRVGMSARIHKTNRASEEALFKQLTELFKAIRGLEFGAGNETGKQNPTC